MSDLLIPIKMYTFAPRNQDYNIKMTQYLIKAPKLQKTMVSLPASKSISNRALIIYALSGGQQMPQNLSDCDDTQVILDALRDMP